MATTTNYGWTTPDDTALVKDGASAIRTLGTSVDTTTKNLNPETTLGDIAYRSSTSNVNTRLGIGGTGTVLTVAGGVPTWATAGGGGLTLISTTTLTGASVTLSSIPQTYNHLQLIVQNWIPVNDNANLRFRFNADSTASRHVSNSMIGDVASSFGSTSAQFSAQQDNGTSQALIVGNVFNYTNTTTWKFYNVHAIGNNSTTTTEANYVTILQGAYNQTTAISSIELFANTGNLTSGTVLLYGVK
jgi:hypothetical protein